MELRATAIGAGGAGGGAATLEPRPSRSESGVGAVMDGVLALDLRGVVTLINPPAERLLGVRALTTLGRHLDELPESGEILDLLRLERGRLDVAREFSRVVEVHHLDGADLLYVRVRAHQLRDHRGEPAGAIVALQDVTSDHKSDQLRNQYLSIVAHELRTPLTGIKTFSTMMCKGVLGGLNDRQKAAIDSIREQSLRLEHQIDKLVNLGHIDTNEYGQDLEVLELTELLRQSVAPFEQPAKDRAIKLAVDAPSGARRVQGDRADLRRAIQALVENAIKFTRDGGQVAVALRDVDGGRIEVGVRDDGVGIEPRYHRRIFEKFFQVEDPLTRHHGGSGLGLFFVKSIVEAHGSSVCVDSRLGAGARFSFVLDRFTDDEEIAAHASPESASPNQHSD